MKVRATEKGFYQKLRQKGDEFIIDKKEHKGKWMEEVKKTVVVKTT